MDRFVKGFIVMSIVYLGIAAALGIIMLGNQNIMALKFVHSHLMLLGWVSMMIYGVGYHILPRFMGRPLYSQRIGDIQFWAASIGLIGMLAFYTLSASAPSGGRVADMVVSGILELAAVLLFFYKMMK